MADIDDAYAVFFQAEYRSVIRTAYLIVRDPQRAEDVAQDAFVQLYRHWPTVSGYEQPDAWIRRVTIRLAVRDVKRAHAREVLEPTFPSASHSALPDLTVLDAVKQLPPMQRAAIALFYLEDRPVAEIAESLSISVSTCTLPPDAWPATTCRSSRNRRYKIPASTTPLEGTWRSVLVPRDLERRGFSAKQIHRLQSPRPMVVASIERDHDRRR